MTAVVGAFAGGCDNGDGLSPDATPTKGQGGGTGGLGSPEMPSAPSDVVPSGSQSFSPTGPQSTPGLPNKLLWTYRTAEGKPVQQSVDGVMLTYTFDDARMEVDQQLKTKITVVKAALQGTSSGVPITGSISQNIVEHLIFAANTSAVADTDIDMRVVMKADTLTVTVDSKVQAKASEPVLWFPDRSDLNDLKIGHEHRQADISLALNGKVTATVDGEQESENIDTISKGTEAWVVKEKLDSLVVLGRRYKDVVKLLRTASSVVDGETTNTEVTFWVARGVGVVQFESFIDGIDKPVLNELISTNVVTLQ